MANKGEDPLRRYPDLRDNFFIFIFGDFSKELRYEKLEELYRYPDANAIRTLEEEHRSSYSFRLFDLADLVSKFLEPRYHENLCPLAFQWIFARGGEDEEIVPNTDLLMFLEKLYKNSQPGDYPSPLEAKDSNEPGTASECTADIFLQQLVKRTTAFAKLKVAPHFYDKPSCFGALEAACVAGHWRGFIQLFDLLIEPAVQKEVASHYLLKLSASGRDVPNLIQFLVNKGAKVNRERTPIEGTPLGDGVHKTEDGLHWTAPKGDEAMIDRLVLEQKTPVDGLDQEEKTSVKVAPNGFDGSGPFVSAAPDDAAPRSAKEQVAAVLPVSEHIAVPAV